MPLFARAFATHYPDRERSPRLDHHIVLCGCLEVGGFYRIGSGPSEGRWSWGATLGSGNADFIAGGHASHGDVCRTLIALAFRRMLARAELRERADAKPGPPRRDPPEPSIEPSEPSSPAVPYDRDADRRLGPMVRNERSVAVRSGALVVGMLSRATHGPERWSWSLTGLHCPDASDFVWHGEVETEDEAFDALAACWSRWLDWAGLEPIGSLERGARG
jgi:hypothetical protein